MKFPFEMLPFFRTCDLHQHVRVRFLLFIQEWYEKLAAGVEDNDRGRRSKARVKDEGSRKFSLQVVLCEYFLQQASDTAIARIKNNQKSQPSDGTWVINAPSQVTMMEVSSSKGCFVISLDLFGVNKKTGQ